MKYEVKYLEEACWAVGIGALSYVLIAFVATDSMTDWNTWIPAVGLGAARAAAGIFLSRFGVSRQSDNPQ